MKNYKVLKFCLWLAGTLIVGALGNGLWEVSKPVVVWMGGAILEVTTFGTTALIDDIYIEVARGTYERAGEQVLTLLLTLILFLPILITLQINFRSLFRNIDNRKVTSEKTKNIISRAKLIVITCMIVLGLTILMQNVRMIYIIRAANHMEQLQRVAAPYLTTENRLIFSSKFSSMRSRDEYISLTNELSSLIKEKNIYVPTFDIY